MTNAQRKAHKQGNQLRKARLMLIQRNCPAPEKHYWAGYGLIQDGKYTTK